MDALLETLQNYITNNNTRFLISREVRFISREVFISLGEVIPWSKQSNKNTPPMPGLPAQMGCNQIGRASCRERV